MTGSQEGEHKKNLAASKADAFKNIGFLRNTGPSSLKIQASI